MNYKNVRLYFGSSSAGMRLNSKQNVLIAPNIVTVGDGTEDYPKRLQQLKLFVAKRLAVIADHCFQKISIRKLVGNNISSVGDNAFADSYFMEQINLKHAKSIGEQAFSQNNLKAISNNEITELTQKQFRLNVGIQKIRMKKLARFDLSAFDSAPIEEFDAPNVVEIINPHEGREEDNVVLTAQNNFRTQENVVQIPRLTAEPDYQELMRGLPAECFEEEEVTEGNCDLFLVENCLVFPPNIKTVKKMVYSGFKPPFFFVFGENVRKIEKMGFEYCCHLRKARFPNLLEVESYGFYLCEHLDTFVAPKCSSVGDFAFGFTLNLKRFVAQPKVLAKQVFFVSGLRYLDLPSVQKVAAEAFQSSQIEGARLENCKEFEKNALVNVFSGNLDGKLVRAGFYKNRTDQLQSLRLISSLAQKKGNKKVKLLGGMRVRSDKIV